MLEQRWGKFECGWRRLICPAPPRKAGRRDLPNTTKLDHTPPAPPIRAQRPQKQPQPGTRTTLPSTQPATSTLQWPPKTLLTRRCKLRSPSIPQPPPLHPANQTPLPQRPPPPPQPQAHDNAPQLPPLHRAGPDRGPPLLRRPAPDHQALPPDQPRVPPLRLQPRRRLVPLALVQPVRPAAGRERRRRRRVRGPERGCGRGRGAEREGQGHGGQGERGVRCL